MVRSAWHKNLERFAEGDYDEEELRIELLSYLRSDKSFVYLIKEDVYSCFTDTLNRICEVQEIKYMKSKN